MLIKCPECGREISDKSKQCIHCGFPLDELENKSNNLYQITLNHFQTNKKMATIKMVIEHSHTELSNAKRLVESIPCVVQVGLSYQQCLDAVKRFESIGATLEISKDLNSTGPNMEYANFEFSPIKPNAPINNTPVSCPKCGSTSVTAGQRGFSIVTGFFGSGQTMNRCANCGHRWKP